MTDPLQTENSDEMTFYVLQLRNPWTTQVLFQNGGHTANKIDGKSTRKKEEKKEEKHTQR